MGCFVLLSNLVAGRREIARGREVDNCLQYNRRTEVQPRTGEEKDGGGQSKATRLRDGGLTSEPRILAGNGDSAMDQEDRSSKPGEPPLEGGVMGRGGGGGTTSYLPTEGGRSDTTIMRRWWVDRPQRRVRSGGGSRCGDATGHDLAGRMGRPFTCWVGTSLQGAAPQRAPYVIALGLS